MKYVDEFRDPKKADRLLREIRALVEQIPVCRTRTRTSPGPGCGVGTSVMVKLRGES